MPEISTDQGQAIQLLALIFSSTQGEKKKSLSSFSLIFHGNSPISPSLRSVLWFLPHYHIPLHPKWSPALSQFGTMVVLLEQGKSSSLPEVSLRWMTEIFYGKKNVKKGENKLKKIARKCILREGKKKKTKTIHTKHEIWRYQPCVMWLCLCAERANRLRVRELAAAKALGSPFENHTLLRLCLFCFRWLSLPSLVAALLGAAADWYGEGGGGGRKDLHFCSRGENTARYVGMRHATIRSPLEFARGKNGL